MPPLGAHSAVAGRYAIGELLGRGGMGEVFDATDLRLDRPVALKRLRSDLADDPAMRRRVEEEARLAARLVHPHVVTVFDSGVDAGHPFIVMERLAGRTLRDDLAQGPLPSAEVRELGLQVLDALGAAHDIGLIHRDVKPGNILAAPAGGWKVADFGIARSVDADHTLTSTGELLGSPSYLAPERLEGLPATAASDLYSLGVLLYEAASGVRPFGDGEPLTIAMRIRDGAHPTLRDVAPGLDERMAAAIERAMALDPAARFGSAAEMATALRGGTPARARRRRTGPRDGAATADADATALIDRPPDRTALLGPGRPRDIAASAAARGRAPRRLLAFLVVGALAVTVALVVVLALTARDPRGSDPASSPAAAPVSGVPASLQDALDRLQDTVSP
jgi:serine/threonine protein kinase